MIRAARMPPAPSLDPATVLAELRTFIANWFRDGRDEGLEPEAPLVTSGLIDSAGVIEVVEFVEQRFHARIRDVDLSLRNCNTLRGWTDLVLRAAAEP